MSSVFVLPQCSEVLFVESPNAPLMREGTTIVQATASLIKQDSNLPIRLEIQSENQVDSLIVLPNQRLQEMEGVIEHDPHALFFRHWSGIHLWE